MNPETGSLRAEDSTILECPVCGIRATWFQFWWFHWPEHSRTPSEGSTPPSEKDPA